MRQEAPDPVELFDLVETLHYKPGFTFTMLPDYDRGQGSVGLTLDIVVTGPDSYHPERTRSVHHLMPVPPAAYDKRSWQRWLFEQCQLVDRHEACEFFRFEIPGTASTPTFVERPYAPSHGPGNDPYIVRELGTDLDRRMRFTGVENPA